MNPRRTLLHSLVDALPDGALDRAVTMLAALEAETPLSPEIIAGVERGIADLKAGRGVEGDAFFAELDAILATRQGSAA